MVNQTQNPEGSEQELASPRQQSYTKCSGKYVKKQVRKASQKQTKIKLYANVSTQYGIAARTISRPTVNL